MKRKRFHRLDLLILVIVALIGLLHLQYPFSGDQALFTIGAMKMKGGAVLYRDFWDLKQPGSFVFYLIAGLLFGFSEAGIHLFELLYWIGFAVVLLLTMRNYFDNRAILSIAPLLTVGVYYGVSGSWHLTQVEGLVGFPLLLALWFASESSTREEHSPRRMFLSGLMGGIVLAFKFLLLPILLSFWFAVILRALVWRREHLRNVAVRILAPTLLGMALPLIILFCYFAAAGTLGLLSYTFFEYPARAISELPRPGWGRLLGGLRWFVGWSAPLLALAFIGASMSRRRSLVTLNLVLWFFVGMGVIFMQRLSWWEYHYLLLVVPLGLLAAKGLDVLWERMRGLAIDAPLRRIRVAAVFVLALLFLPLIVTLASKSLVLARHGFALDRERRLQYQSVVGQDYSVSDYKTALEEVAFLSEPSSLPGKIHVCGNPVYYYLSGREPSIASNGWMLELFLPEQWSEMTAQLAKARPPYLFISAEYPDIIRSRSPLTTNFIEKHYRELRRSSAGVWYVLREEQ